jgi:hypothetical protein
MMYRAVQERVRFPFRWVVADEIRALRYHEMQPLDQEHIASVVKGGVWISVIHSGRDSVWGTAIEATCDDTA